MGKLRFPLPKLDYFQFGNVFSGSQEDFNYKITPKDGLLKAKTWYGKLCGDLSKVEAEAEFPLDQEGLDKLEAWLDGQEEICQRSYIPTPL